MFRTRGPLSREDQRGGGRGGGRGKGGEGELGRGSNRGAGRGERGGRGLAKERWRDHSIAGEDGVADGKLYESAGKLPPFTLSGADVAHAGVLARVAEQIAWRREVILVCGDGSAYASPTALNTVLQFWALGLRHTLFVSDSAQSCASLRRALPSLACVWSSRIPKTKPENDGLCNRNFWDMRFYFYHVRKEMVARLAVDHGLNVLQTDTDVAWFANPYPVFKGAYNTTNLITQVDAPYVNAGVFYVQNVPKGSGLAWALFELHRRIDLFMFHPERVVDYVKWAKPPFFSNSDEQTLMNDVLVSSITNFSCYAGSTAYMEMRYGGSHKIGWENVPEKALLASLYKAVGKSVTKVGGHAAYPLHVLGGVETAPTYYSRAPKNLFQHYNKEFVTFPGGKNNTVENVVNVTEAVISARREKRPIMIATRRRMAVCMVHMSSVRTGAWARRALLRSHGWWHSRADELMSGLLNWQQRTGVLRLGASGVVEAQSIAEIDMLAGNLLLLAALSNRVAVIPEMTCAFERSGRGFAHGLGGLSNRVETAPRVVDGRFQKRCAWVPPRACWKQEFIHQLEWERQIPPSPDDNEHDRPVCDSAVESLIMRMTHAASGAEAGSASASRGNSSAPRVVTRQLRHLFCDSAAPDVVDFGCGSHGCKREERAERAHGGRARLAVQTLLMQRPLVHPPADPSNQREWGRPISELAKAFANATGQRGLGIDLLLLNRTVAPVDNGCIAQLFFSSLLPPPAPQT